MKSTIMIALLRGINVGGHKKTPMAELRELLITKGLTNVKTYIQSGNVLFDNPDSSIEDLSLLIANAIKTLFYFEVPVIVKSETDLLRIFDACPFSEEIKQNSMFVILEKAPAERNKKMVLSGTAHDGETFKIINDCLYFYSETGYGRTKFNMKTMEKKLEVNATSRNYKTMVKLVSLASEN